MAEMRKWLKEKEKLDKKNEKLRRILAVLWRKSVNSKHKLRRLRRDPARGVQKNERGREDTSHYALNMFTNVDVDMDTDMESMVM